jgi:Dynein heavy chain C-terminal domain
MKYEPLIAWLPGLTNPRSYLLTVLQTACRKYHWPIEQAGLAAQITNAKHLPAPKDVRFFYLAINPFAAHLHVRSFPGHLRERNLLGERRLGRRAAVFEECRGLRAVGGAARRPNHCKPVRAGTTSGEKIALI